MEYIGIRLERLVVLVLIHIVSLPLSAQTGTLVDTRDGKTYKTVQIGSQIWMAENLAYAPVITLASEHGGYFDTFYKDDSCYYFCYADNKNNIQKYGALYTWETAMKACPAGWHLPTKNEYKTLFSAAGKNKKGAYRSLIAGGDSGFNAILCGDLFGYLGSGHFNYEGRYSFLWTATKVGCCVRIRASFWRAGKHVNVIESQHDDAYSVRCIKDDEK